MKKAESVFTNDMHTCYFTGIGIDKNEEYALVLFRKSASMGNKKAIETLRKLNK